MKKLFRIWDIDMTVEEEKKDNKNEVVMLLSYQKEENLKNWCVYSKGSITSAHQQDEIFARETYNRH